MDYDKDKIDEITLALLYLSMSKTPNGARAWKGHDIQALTRLHQKGMIAEPKIKDLSLFLTPEGAKQAEELFKKHFQVKTKAK